MTLFPYFRLCLLLYFVIGMHIILATPGGTGLYLSFNVFAWIGITLLISLGLWQITLTKKFRYKSFHIHCFIALVFIFIPSLYENEFVEFAIPRLIALFAGFILLLSLAQFTTTQKQNAYVLLIILLGVGVESTFGLIQFFILEKGDWGGYKVGLNRPHGAFIQPNVMASFMATGVALCFYLSIKPIFERHKRAYLFFLYYCLFSACFLLFFLQSRIGFLGAILSICLLSYYLYRRNKRQLLINLSIVALAIFVASLVSIYKPFIKRSQDIYQQAGPRTEIYSTSVKMILDKPISGYGYGNFERSYLDYANQLKLLHPEINKPIQKLSHPHNEILYWGVEGGLLALIGLGILCFAYILILRKMSNAKACALLALIIPIFLHSQTEFPFYSSVSHWIILLIILWYTNQQSKDDTVSIQYNQTFLLRFFALFIPFLSIPFLITTIHTGVKITEFEKHNYENPEILKEIINPLPWRKRLEAHTNAQLLVSGIRNKDTDKINKYIQWGLKTVKYQPRESIYINLLICLKLVNKQQLYLQVLKEAKSTYPLKESWDESYISVENQ